MHTGGWPAGISLTFRLLGSRSDAPVPKGGSRRDAMNSVCLSGQNLETSICFPRQIPFAKAKSLGAEKKEEDKIVKKLINKK